MLYFISIFIAISILPPLAGLPDVEASSQFLSLSYLLGVPPDGRHVSGAAGGQEAVQESRLPEAQHRDKQ